MLIDDAFPDVTSIKNMKWVGGLQIDGLWKKNFYGGVYIKRGLEAPNLGALEAIKSGPETTRISWYFTNATGIF